MATSREHFALDWIKGELLETLNAARQGLEAFAEALDEAAESRDGVDAPGASAVPGATGPLRDCLNHLHQVHGTLVMLELKGVTLLADHLERVAERLAAGTLQDVPGASQTLMQGILELPGYLDELQAGAADSESGVLPLVNELRAHLGEPALQPGSAGTRLYGVAGESALARFRAIDGIGKVRKIRGAYQQVLLSLLKGGDLGRAADTLRKVAHGMGRVCEGTPFEAQWQAFGEFVESVAAAASAPAPLDSEAVKLLRRVDSELREIAQKGEEALRRPVSIHLVRALVDAATERGRTGEALEGLAAALAESQPGDGMSLSGRQALASAAMALREELGLVKDRLDLFVRGGRGDAGELGELLAPLKQIGSTLSLLGFESSKSIVLDQVDALAAMMEEGRAGEGAILNVAGALVQVDENLASLTQSGKGEAEQIADDAQRAVAQQIREDLEQIKQSVVDYVSSQWDVRHLQEVPARLDAVTGALRMIPLSRAAELVNRTQGYVRLELMAGHVPSWQELDRLADALSGIDYYLERLVSETPAGAEDVLDVVQRSLEGLGGLGSAAPAHEPTEHGSPLEAAEAATEPTPEPEAPEAPEPPEPEPLYGSAEEVDLTASAEPGDEEPELELEAEEDFDLSSEIFDEITAGADDEAADETEAAGHEEANEPAAAAPAPQPPPPEPSRQPVQSSPAEPSALPETLVDRFDSDDEIVEIFVEEVDEVLAAVDDHLTGWERALGDEGHQGEIRRAFHTLKGSGRLVGANVLGEMAWSVENMLNRLLDGTVEVSAEFVDVVRAARDLTPALRDAFEQKRVPEMAGVARVMEQADILASGGTLADADEAGPGTKEAGLGDWPDDHRALFVSEAEAHLGALETARGEGTFLLTDEVMRALHTLAGSAAMAGIPTLGELAAPANELGQALRRGSGPELEGERAAFFADVADAMAGMLADVKAGREPEDAFQLVAEADRLLAGAAAPSPATGLLGLPALEAVLTAPDLLAAWRESRPDAAELRQITAALADIARAAAAEKLAPVAELAQALLGAHERLADSALTGAAHAVLADAHDRLLAALDALAADQTPEPAGSVLADLAALMPEGSPKGPPEGSLEAPPAESAAAAAAEPAPASSDDWVLDEVVAEVAGEEPPAGFQDQPVVAEADAGAQAAPPPDVDDDALVPDDVDDEIIGVFFEEADELLEALDESINDWSREADNRLHLENLLRVLHTLKGGARLSGLAHLGDRTHDFESFLIDVQERGEPADAALFGTLHARYDEIAGLVARIRKLLSGEAVATPAAPPETVAPPSPEPPATAPEPAPAPAAAQPESRPAGDAARPVAEPAPHKPEAAELEPAAASSAAPAPADGAAEPAAARARTTQEMIRVGASLLEELVNLAGESSIIRARVEQGMSDFTSALEEMETTIERLREQLRRLEIETEAQILFRQERPDAPDYEDFDPLEMDRYSQLQQLSRSLTESASDMLDLKETLLYKAREAETLLLQQGRVNTELQEGLMRSRMVPFSRLVPRLQRTVRQVAKELRKDVELHALNVEGELDRTLLERMLPPLEHMLRNAVDHGIEAPEERRHRGKAAAGRIDLRLSREGGDVVIEISDDGAGIDVERVRAKALERGLMAPDASLSDDEISQFVLAPGFSTASAVTQISGRGVGMDVVHSEVKQLGGSISIASERGRGTRFVLRVPFTVSVNRALMVSVADDLYAIPLNTIEGIVLLSQEELDRLYAPDGNTFEYAGVPYRIQYLGSFLGREYRPQPLQGSIPVVLVRSGEHAVAVHVDAVQGSREIVVKSLGPQFAGVGGISGATILGDGSVVVILDLLALIRAQNGASRFPGKRTLTGAARTRCVMVVDDSVTVRKVTSRLLERQGMDVLVAKDGVEAVSLLQERRPDVMLLDIEMPRMDGFEVLRQVRRDERLADLPIVMISSRTGAKHQDRAAELGVNRFLGKPFQENELLATIDELVNG